jgi:hypothetical protein
MVSQGGCFGVARSLACLTTLPAAENARDLLGSRQIGVDAEGKMLKHPRNEPQPLPKALAPEAGTGATTAIEVVDEGERMRN